MRYTTAMSLLHAHLEKAASTPPSHCPHQFISIREQMSCRAAHRSAQTDEEWDSLSPGTPVWASTFHSARQEATDRSITTTLIASLNEVRLYKPLKNIDWKLCSPNSLFKDDFGNSNGHCSWNIPVIGLIWSADPETRAWRTERAARPGHSFVFIWINSLSFICL